MVTLIKNKFFYLSLLFLVTRFFSITPGPVFFDSPEYMLRFADSSFFDALTIGHVPLHIGYVIFGWPLFHLTTIVYKSSYFFVIFFQIILSYAGYVSFYKFVKRVFNDEIALFSSSILLFLPLYWISQVTILMESVYVPSFMISLYFLYLYLKADKADKYLFFSSLFFAFSLLVHIAILLWLPVFVFLTFVISKKKIFVVVSTFLCVVFLTSVISAYFLSVLHNGSLFDGFKLFFVSKLEERAFFELTILSTARYARNAIFPTFVNNTYLVTLLCIPGLYVLAKRSLQYFLVCLLWVAPVLFVNQWWDSVFFGRHSLIASYCLALLSGLVLAKRKYLKFLFVFYLIATTVPSVWLLKNPVPYVLLSDSVARLDSSSLLLLSHFERPQLELNYQGDFISVGEPAWKSKDTELAVKSYISENNKVFVTSHALSDPYGLYSGPYLHPLTLSYRNQPYLFESFQYYFFKPISVVNSSDNLIIYQIKEERCDTCVSYPVVQMSTHRRRLDSYDAGYIFFRTLNL